MIVSLSLLLFVLIIVLIILQIRTNFFAVRVVNTWNELPEEVVNAPSVNAFKSRLDKLWEKTPLLYDRKCYHT